MRGFIFESTLGIHIFFPNFRDRSLLSHETNFLRLQLHEIDGGRVASSARPPVCTPLLSVCPPPPRGFCLRRCRTPLLTAEIL